MSNSWYPYVKESPFMGYIGYGGGATSLAHKSGSTTSPPRGDRGIWAGGRDNTGPNPKTNRIDYVALTSTGNCSDFGDIPTAGDAQAGVSNGTRGVFGGLMTPGTPELKNSIDYITIGTTGNASDFGDLTQARHGLSASSGIAAADGDVTKWNPWG